MNCEGVSVLQNNLKLPRPFLAVDGLHGDAQLLQMRDHLKDHCAQLGYVGGYAFLPSLLREQLLCSDSRAAEFCRQPLAGTCCSPSAAPSRAVASMPVCPEPHSRLSASMQTAGCARGYLVMQPAARTWVKWLIVRQAALPDWPEEEELHMPVLLSAKPSLRGDCQLPCSGCRKLPIAHSAQSKAVGGGFAQAERQPTSSSQPAGRSPSGPALAAAAAARCAGSTPTPHL